MTSAEMIEVCRVSVAQVSGHSPFTVRGVAEGFYGPPLTFPERDDLIRFAGGHGYNLYVYAPKNDREGRSRWWEPYPDKIMTRFARTIGIARSAGVDFCYAISPGLSMCYSSAEDFGRLTARLRAFYDLGVRTFALMLDDIGPVFRHAADRAVYASYAAAHAGLSNRLYAWLKSLDPACGLIMCPVDYHGRAPFGAYLRELGESLHPQIDIFYTGPEICSRTITAHDAEDFARVAGRRPLIWDNYPVNDLAMQPEMHIGPVRGREAGLAEATRGIVANIMSHPEASKVALLTFAGYFADPNGYDPDRSWSLALREVAGDESFEDLCLFAENSLASCLGVPEAERLDRLVHDALAALRRGERASSSPAVAALDVYVGDLDEARYRLVNRLDNLALRNDLLPWLDLLDLWCWMARRALLVLYAQDRGEPYDEPLRLMQEWLEAIRRHPRRLAGNCLLGLADYVMETVLGIDDFARADDRRDMQPYAGSGAGSAGHVEHDSGAPDG